METELLVVVGIMTGVVTGVCGVFFAILNYYYKKKMDQIDLNKEKEDGLFNRLESKLKETLLITIKEEMRDYVEMTALEIKRELASSMKLVDKDIFFLNQMVLGRNTKSVNPMLEDKEETQEHKDEEEVGIFKPTTEEREERSEGDFSTQKDTNL